MPRPSTKEQLLTEMQQERQALEAFLATLTPDEMTRPGAIAEWSVKDVLAHLIEWEQMVLAWYKAGRRGQTPHTPAEGYTWGQLPELNQRIYEKHKGRALDDVTRQFRASYRQMLKLVQGLTEEELFTPSLHAWMKKNTLAAYINSATSSHYRWARTEMRKGLKAGKKRA